MSAGFRHISQGMAGVTAAPRPTLVKAACGLSAVEHDSDVATTSAPRDGAARLLNVLIFDMGDHRLRAH